MRLVNAPGTVLGGGAGGVERCVEGRLVSRLSKLALVPALLAVGASAANAEGVTLQRAPSVAFAQNVYEALDPGYRPSASSAHRALEAHIRAIGQSFNGDIGIAVRDVESGWTAAFVFRPPVGSACQPMTSAPSCVTRRPSASTENDPARL